MDKWRPFVDPAPWPEMASPAVNLGLFALLCVVALMTMRVLHGGSPWRVFWQGLLLGGVVWALGAGAWWVLGETGRQLAIVSF